MKTLLALAAVVLALAGCSSQADQQREAADALVTHLQRIHTGDFAGACELIDPTIRDYGMPCVQQLQQQWPQQQRDELVNIAVDSSRVDVKNTHARIPGAAITFNGHPNPGDYELRKIDDHWLVG